LNIRPTALPGVLVIEPAIFRDDRGWFMETFNAAKFAELGLPTEFAQDNHSSSRKGVIRGLHYQLDPPQGKLVRCIRGTIFDVAVDIDARKWTGVELSAENRLMLWIPAGYAHGFSVLSDEADVAYKCTAVWNPQTEKQIVFDDAALAIDWRVENPIVSERDRAAPRLAP
jgi:dTDP-4-dehydrorhamnose 3,5-epimerase